MPCSPTFANARTVRFLSCREVRPRNGLNLARWGGTRRERARKGLVLALTHAIDEVRSYAATGIGWHLWEIDRNLALLCVRALAAEAVLVQQAFDLENSRPREPRAPFENAREDQPRSVDELEAEAESLIRAQLLEEQGIAADVDMKFDPTASFGAEANTRILSILGAAPTEQAATDAFERLGQTLVDWWVSDDDHRSRDHRSRGHRRRERNFDTEYAQSKILQRFLLRAPLVAASKIVRPILDVVNTTLRKLVRFSRG
jgi:hypothetical protein